MYDNFISFDSFHKFWFFLRILIFFDDIDCWHIYMYNIDTDIDNQLENDMSWLISPLLGNSREHVDISGNTQ